MYSVRSAVNRLISTIQLTPGVASRTVRRNVSSWPSNQRTIVAQQQSQKNRRPAAGSPPCSQQTHYRLFSNVANHEAVDLNGQNETENNAETVKVIYVDRDGERHEIAGKVGDNVMYLAQRHDLEIEGACEASLACCTCHVYVKEEFYDMLGELDEEEEDMLDLAPFLKENSRLSCQIILSKELDGIEVHLPSATRNFYVDGHKPKPH